MQNNGWIELNDTILADGDADRTILVWHVFQGAMAVLASKVCENRYYVYWQEVRNEWIDPVMRLPTVDDADAYNCVVSLDYYGDIRVTGWHQIYGGGKCVGWQSLPSPPADHRARWRNAN